MIRVNKSNSIEKPDQFDFLFRTQFDVCFVGQQHVLALYVSVYNLVLMQVIQSL